MRVPLSWLRDFAPVDVPLDELLAVLSDLGLPVESVTSGGDDLTGVVIARVLEIDSIEGADKIRRVVVDAGGEPVQVVCGAWNFDVGATVPLATVGTVLPGNFEIAKRKMKGVESHGMLCAPDELGLPGDHSGILVLPNDLVPGTDFAEAMGITHDVVLELEVNPNRPDAMSIAGVARDVAARLGLPFAIPEPSARTGAPAEAIVVDVSDPVACPRFTARVVRGITVGPSPAWMAQRLTLAGMRPINNVVDASNYVMLELGQPNHAYDLAKLPGRGLRVRMARAGEALVTLDGVERHFSSDDLLICDGDDNPAGIAGIMGGAASEVDEGTTEVLLEAAWFHPLTISWTSKRLALRSEASARFEKGIDHAGIDRAVARFVELLGAESTPTAAAVAAERPKPAPIRVRTARVNAVLGTTLTDADIQRLLDPIGFTTVVASTGELDVTIPTWRPDSAVEIDVVEEVARTYGYPSIERTVPRSTITGGLTPLQRDRRLVRQILAGAGASEAWTSTFVSDAELVRCGLDPAEAVRVSNPLVADESLLRTSLLPGLLRSLAYNASHRELGVWLFEIGNAFRTPGDPLPDERELVAVALGGADAHAAVALWHVLAEGLLVRDWRLERSHAPGMHPTRTARLIVDGHPVGHVGEVDPAVLDASDVPERVGWLQLDLVALVDAPHGPDLLVPVSRYPSSDTDLSFAVDDAAPAGDVLQTLRNAGVSELVDVSLFDVYRGAGVAAGTRSLTFRLRLQAPDRTLTDDELATARQRLIDAVEHTHEATLRS